MSSTSDNYFAAWNFAAPFDDSNNLFAQCLVQFIWYSFPLHICEISNLAAF